MKITISIETGNAAFTDNPGELTRIINRAADIAGGIMDGFPALESPPYVCPLRDSNGNKVGFITIE